MNDRRQFIAAGAAVLIALAAPVWAESGQTGQFGGKSNHVTTGHAKLVTTGGKTVVDLQSDFTFDGAPDPKVALGRDGKLTLLGKLRSNSGAQSYEVPAGVSTDGVNEIWIWCEKFNVPLGVARLN